MCRRTTVGDDSPADDAGGYSASPVGHPACRTVSSSDILQGDREVLIQHGEHVYRLRVTKAGKLILNK
jgi:hemin uptake protein HemP